MLCIKMSFFCIKKQFNFYWYLLILAFKDWNFTLEVYGEHAYFPNYSSLGNTFLIPELIKLCVIILPSPGEFKNVYLTKTSMFVVTKWI